MNKSIWSPKPKYMPPNQACTKIPYKGYEISIAMDDSCGAFDTLCRSDIRVFRDTDDADISNQIAEYMGQSMIYGDAEDLKAVLSWIDIHGDFE